MSKKKTLKDIVLNDKTILMRVDYNVPLDKDLNVTNTTRIDASLESIKYILEQKNTKLVLMSHLGRPKGKRDPKLSLLPVAKVISQKLQAEVTFINDCIGESVQKQVSQLNTGEILLLENLRFHPEEEKNSPEFARQLALLGDIYVNDAFGTAHRAHASTEGVAKYIPAVMGFLMQKEMEALDKVLHEPKKPFVAVLGGAKISSKIGVIKKLIDKVDAFLIGGGMTYTFYEANNQYTGDSLVEQDKIKEAREIMQLAKEKNIEIVLPIDNVVAEEVDENAKATIVDDQIPKGQIGVDIGPKTIDLFKEKLSTAKTVFWNGPVGVFEIPKFSNGTLSVAQLIADLDADTIAGGGDSLAAIERAKVADKFTHVSTGGGASLEYLEGMELPGIAALNDLE